MGRWLLYTLKLSRWINFSRSSLVGLHSQNRNRESYLYLVMLMLHCTYSQKFSGASFSRFRKIKSPQTFQRIQYMLICQSVRLSRGDCVQATVWDVVRALSEKISRWREHVNVLYAYVLPLGTICLLLVQLCVVSLFRDTATLTSLVSAFWREGVWPVLIALLLS